MAKNYTHKVEDSPHQALDIIEELNNQIPEQEGEDYTEFQTGEDNVADHPYLQKHAGVTIIKEFSKQPNFQKNLKEGFKGILSPVHGVTFYKEEKAAFLLHGFEQVNLLDEMNTAPIDLTFDRQKEVSGIRLHFYGQVNQSIGDTTERRNNRTLLSGNENPLPTNTNNNKRSLFGLGGK